MNQGTTYGNINEYDNEMPRSNRGVQNIKKQIGQACKAFKKLQN